MTNVSNTKKCRDCGEIKTMDCFAPDKRNKDGRVSYCRPCYIPRISESKSLNRSHYRTYIRNYMREYRRRKKQQIK